jgi:hypothetical protein
MSLAASSEPQAVASEYAAGVALRMQLPPLVSTQMFASPVAGGGGGGGGPEVAVVRSATS